jgi:thioredoxin-like negative regulator of GroEL
MKVYVKKIMIGVAVCMMFNVITVAAKVRVITSRRAFETNVATQSMVVALFYNTKDKDLARMYEDIAASQQYNDADLMFLKINAARNDLRELASLYGVTAMPAFIFFDKGKRLTNTHGVSLQLTGAVTRDQLQAFIDQHYSQEIKKLVDDKSAVQEERVREEDESWKEYFYPRTMNVKGYSTGERMLE